MMVVKFVLKKSCAKIATHCDKQDLFSKQKARNRMNGGGSSCFI